MSKFFKRLSFASRSTRPAAASKSSEPQDSSASSQVPNLSSRPSKAASSQQRAAELYATTLGAINEAWDEGLTRFGDFDLLSALSIFKNLLRTLRSPEDEHPPDTIDNEASKETPPYRFLLPEEVALLFINIALIHGFLGSYYLAAIAFDEALLLDEASAIAWFGLGIAKFHLHELRASKRAFRKCHKCFLNDGTVGSTHWMDKTTYKIWNGDQSLATWYAAVNHTNNSEDASSPGLLPRKFFAQAFPKGVWKLRRSRVAWNFSVVGQERERKKLRKKGQEDIGPRRHLKGIPVGVIFALDVEARNRLVNSNEDNNQTSKHFVKKNSRGNSAETIIQYGKNPVGELRGTPAHFVKQNWAVIQQKLKNRKTDHAAIARLLASSPPNVLALSDSADSRGRSVSRGRMSRTPTQRTVSHQQKRPRSASLPPSSFNSRVVIPNRFEDALSDEDDHSFVPSNINIRNSINAASPNNHPHENSSPRLSSVISFRWTRASRSSAIINDTMQAIDNFREELEADAQGDRSINPDNPESQNENDINGHTHSPSTQYVQHQQDSSNHDDADTPDSHYNHRWTTIQPGDIALPNLMQDLTTDTLSDTYILPATTYIPPPRFPPSNLSDSFMTDGVSSLGSHDRAHMFPSLDSTPSSRRPSYAFVDSTPSSCRPSAISIDFLPSSRRPSADYNSAAVPPTDQQQQQLQPQQPHHHHHGSHSSNGTIIWNPAYEEAYEHLSGRRRTT
ncbi:MAG: hypothetical protein LQ350_004625, partial [Teloschistes chrysophthalmus]